MIGFSAEGFSRYLGTQSILVTLVLGVLYVLHIGGNPGRISLRILLLVLVLVLLLVLLGIPTGCLVARVGIVT